MHRLRVVPVDRPGLTTPRCGIELELDAAGRLPDPGAFTPVPHRERPTYWFGDIDTSADRLAAALRHHLPERTRVG